MNTDLGILVLFMTPMFFNHIGNYGGRLCVLKLPSRNVMLLYLMVMIVILSTQIDVHRIVSSPVCIAVLSIRDVQMAITQLKLNNRYIQRYIWYIRLLSLLWQKTLLNYYTTVSSFLWLSSYNFDLHSLPCWVATIWNIF